MSDFCGFCTVSSRFPFAPVLWGNECLGFFCECPIESEVRSEGFWNTSGSYLESHLVTLCLWQEGLQQLEAVPLIQDLRWFASVVLVTLGHTTETNAPRKQSKGCYLPLRQPPNQHLLISACTFFHAPANLKLLFGFQLVESFTYCEATHHSDCAGSHFVLC